MFSFRVHATDADTARVPYLTLSLTASNRISMDFASMEADPANCVPSVVLSKAAVYEVLQGNTIRINGPQGDVALIPGSTDLIIDCESFEGKRPRSYRVGLSEIGLGWNLLRDSEYVA